MIFRSLIFVLMICLGFPLSGSYPRANTKAQTDAEWDEEKEQEVLRLEELGRQKFLRGDTQWDDIMADSAYMVGWTGTVTIYKKGQTLPGMPMKSFVHSDLIARVYGETVVVTGLAEAEGETPDKKSFSFKTRYVNVWRKFREGWRIVVTENTVVRSETPK